jgi:putative transposase
MPRHARLDIPGLLQHVMVRGIERRKIFLDETDRSLFVGRLSALLEETNTDCFAWALLPNHFHLLLRPNRIELKQFMRRLLTGYAITFNHRHKRAGHVFQNRYKSIVCEEETYLLELIRYIHLNPLRARLVPDPIKLNEYPWCGHSVLMGKNEMPGQVVQEVLARFGETLKKSRLSYHLFITNGVGQGKRDEFVGGGLQRSRKGQIEPPAEMKIFDERVLGSSNFIEQLRKDHVLQEKLTAGMMLPVLINRVGKYFGLETVRIKQRSKDKAVMTARDVFCYIAIRVLRHSGTNVGNVLNIHRSAVSHAVRRGEGISEKNNDLVDKILKQA